MKKLKLISCISWLVVAGAAAVACGGDDSDSDADTDTDGGSGGSSGSHSGGTNMNGGGDEGDAGGMAGEDSGGSGAAGGGAGSGASGGEAGGGSPGSVGMAGEAGAGGGAGSPGGTDPVTGISCASFPTTVMLGPTIQLNVTGAVLCFDSCRLTTNTYSDGAGACEHTDSGPIFATSTAGAGSNYATLQGTWEWVSSSAGTINTDFKYVLSDIPSATAVTAVIKEPGGTEHTVVFEFDGAGGFTLTSHAVE